jgi:hypothetical protein
MTSRNDGTAIGLFEMRKFCSLRTKIYFAAFAVLASPVMSQPVSAPTLVALSGLEAGQWQLRSSDSAEKRSICVNDPVALLQIEHPSSSCSRFIIQNEPRTTTVHYSCPGAGYGRTTLRMETSRLVQIESQGIANKAPFSVHLEARRVGACSVGTTAHSLTTRLPSFAKPRPVLSFK